MTDTEWQILGLTFEVAALSAAFVVPFAILAALAIMRLTASKQVVAMSLLSLPMALPPVITGYVLLLLLGRQSFFGTYLFEAFGLQVSFSFAGAVVASCVVSFPFALRSVLVSLKSIDRTLLDCAATLKIPRFRTFIWIVLPLSWPGIAGAGVLAFVRAFGEFGATVVFAGGVFGESRTLSVAIWNLLQTPNQEAAMWRLLVISVSLCFAALIVSELLFRRMSWLQNNR